ncbi:MAG: ATP-binding protein, partial [Verrucomicrobiota bacterium]
LLEPGVRRLEFKFVSPDFTAPERVRYRHKLDDGGADWSPVSADAMAAYTNVAPGRHRLRVLACNGDGVWNEQGASLAFTVAPFFWQTWWFPPLVVAGGTLLLAASIRWVALRRLQRRIVVLEAEHALEKERGRIAQDIHDELGANLTTIGWLADLGFKHREQPGAVVQDLEKIAATARQSLSAMDAIVWALNPRNDSSENFVNYVAHFANEFLQPTGIRCRLDIPADLPVRPMSTESRHHLFLAIKEALHNVVQHSRAGEVWIRLADTETEFRISIADNGCGLPAEMTRPGQDGLAGIRRRVEALAGNLQVESSVGAGTSLHFIVPWVRIKPR